MFSQPYAADNLAAVVGLPGLSFTDLVRWSGAMTAGSANLFDDPEVWKVSDRARADVDAAIDEAIPYLREHPDSSMLSVMIHSDDRLPYEVVRVYPPIHLTVKKSVAHDIELGGVRVPGGSSVISFFYAGNRDPEQFENPTVFDVTRERRPGLTFGIGAHGCAGAHIAKAAVGGAAWPMLYERLGGLRAIDPEAHQQEGWVFRRLPELPVTWDEVQD